MNIEQMYVERLRNGSYKDFTKLYELYASHLYAFAFGLTRSEDLAEDIVQETFIKVWVRRELINLDMSFKSFLFTMARNQLLNEFRRQVNNPLFMDDVAYTEPSEGSETTVERKISIDEFNQRLEQAKQKLTPRQRELFELNKEQGVSVQEIVTKIPITEQSVRNQVSQALQVLKKELGRCSFLLTLFFL